MSTAFEPLPKSRAGIFVRLFYWLCGRRLGRVPASIGIMAHHPGVLRSYGLFEVSAERSHALDPRLKALANLRAAMVVGCRFCIDIGSAHALQSGLSEEALIDLTAWTQSSRFDPLEREVLRLTDAMSEAPAHIDARWIASLERSLGRAALVELVSVIAWENYRARFNHAFGAKEEGFSPSYCRLEEALAAPNA
ncbi:MAG: carboxymuconolactone decarboxylase family protein [Myxococcota bacterium]